MKLGLMQPYLFPYLGYFQLIRACDLFVIHDDVQYIKGGWINRNRMLSNGAAKHFTLPLANDSSDKMILERRFTAQIKQEKLSILRQFENAYRRAPFVHETLALVKRCFEPDETNVSEFVTATVMACCEHIGITTPIKKSSQLSKDPSTKAAARVLDINRIVGASHYLNPVGGIELYEKQFFAEAGITLNFLKCHEVIYRQFENPFVPSLSIIDVLMFNSVDSTRKLLDEYDLI